MRGKFIIGSIAMLAVAGLGPLPTVLASSDGDLYYNGNEVAFIQMTISGGTVSGIMYDAADSNNRLQIRTATLSGTATGGRVGVELSSTGQTVSGTYSSSEIDLDFQQNDGSIADIKFKLASIANYNADLQQLRQNIAYAQQVQQAADAAQAHAKKIAQAEQQVDAAVNSVPSDESAIRRDLQSIANDLATMKNDLNRESNDLKVTLQDEQKVVKESKSKSSDPGYAGSVGADAGTVGADSGTVGADQGSVGADDGSIQADFSPLSTDIQSLNNDYGYLLQAHAIVPKYRPTAPKQVQSEILSFMKSVSGIFQKDKRLEASYLQQAQQMVDQANHYAQVASDAASGMQ